MAFTYAYYWPGILLLFILLLLLYRSYQKYVAPYNGFPNSWVFLKTVKVFLSGKVPDNSTPASYIFRELIEDCKKSEKHGFCVYWLPKPHVLILNEEAVKILSNETAALHKADIYQHIIEAIGNGLITSNGDLWRNRRKLLNPAVNLSMLKSYIPVFNKNARGMVQDLSTLAEDAPVEIIDFLNKCTFANLMETIFHLEIEEIEEDIKDISKIVEMAMDLVADRIQNPLLRLDFILPLFPFGKKYIKCLNEVKTWTRKLLLKVKSSYKSTAQNNTSEDTISFGRVPKSAAEILVKRNLEDPSFTIEDMMGEINTLLFAGFKTVSDSLMWCLFLLGNHQDIQDNVYDELKFLTEDELLYNDVQSLTYTECVIKESLRLYPTAPMYAKKLTENVQCGSFTMVKGTNIVFFPYFLQRNPRLYPDPQRFDPERFMGNTGNNPGSYTPFAEGIRTCLGKKYSMIEMKIILAHLLRSFRVTSRNCVEDIEVGWKFTLTPSQPIQLYLTPRSIIM